MAKSPAARPRTVEEGQSVDGGEVLALEGPPDTRHPSVTGGQRA